MVLQTCRHVVDFSFNEANHDATANTSPTAALSDQPRQRRLDGLGAADDRPADRRALGADRRAHRAHHPPDHLLRAARRLRASRRRYTTAGRVLRSLTRKARRTDRAAQALADLADSGPARRAAWPACRPARRRPRPPSRSPCRRGRSWSPLAPRCAGPGWQAVPGAARLRAARRPSPSPGPSRAPWTGWSRRSSGPPSTAQSCILAAKAEVNGALPAAFGLVAAVAYHHYDTVYRIRGDAGAPPRWLVRAIGGHEGRTLVVVVLAALLTRLAVHGRAHGPRRGRGAAGARREHPLLGDRSPGQRARRTRRRRTRMIGLVLAAGAGRRLRPYTDTLPKALVPVDGETHDPGHRAAQPRRGRADRGRVVVGYAAEAVYERKAALEERHGVKLTLVAQRQGRGVEQRLLPVVRPRRTSPRACCWSTATPCTRSRVEQTLLAARGDRRASCSPSTREAARRRGDEGRPRRRRPACGGSPS